jgi:hypothetical protein
MAETLRHKRWERTGRTFEVLDNLGQAIPNKFALTTRIGEKNVDAGDGTFAPYLLNGVVLRHGDSECEFANGWQTIRRLGQVLVSQSRLYIQRETSPGVWTDVPHGIPTRNIAHDYPREGKCAAYLDFPNIQGYAAGARLQIGVEVGGGDRQTYGFRMRSPVAGRFRLEWILEIPEDIDLSWIETPTSKTDPTPIRVGGRIGQTEIRWSATEAPFRSATVESDGSGGRILHLFLGPYDLQAQQWLIVYPDTIGPISVSANADDWNIPYDGTWSFYDDVLWPGEGWNEPDWVGTRFILPSAIPVGATITDSTLTLIFIQANANWLSGEKFLKIYATDSADAAQVTTAGGRPDISGGSTTVTTQSVRWPTSGDLNLPANGSSMTSNSIAAIIQELVNDYSGLAQSAHIVLWFGTYPDGNHGSAWYEIEVASFENTTLDPAALTIVYTTTAIDQLAARFRNDDGSEATATWAATENTNLMAAAGTKRVRAQLNNTGDPAAIIPQWEFRYKPSGGSFGPWRKMETD